MNMDSGNYEYLIQAIFDVITNNGRLPINKLKEKLMLCGFSEQLIDVFLNRLGFKNSVSISDLHSIPYGNVRKCTPIAVTYPPYDNRGMPALIPYGNAILSIIDVIKDIIISAKHKIVILSPFVEDNGLQFLDEILIAKMKSGVEVTIIARQLDEDSDRKNKLFHHIRNNYSRFSNFKLYNYHYVSPEGNIDSTCHAKAVSSDDRYAYLGSADIRYRAFYNNLEIGSIHRGYEAKVISGLLDEVIAVSKRILVE